MLAADQASKALVRATLPSDPPQTIRLIPGVLWLTHVRNQGAAFGVMSGRQLLFIATTLAVLAGIAYAWRRYPQRNAVIVRSLGLVTGGAIGNLIDRVLFGGRVTDFLDVHWFPVFNIADSAIVVGVAVLVIWLLFHEDAADEASAGPGADDAGAGQV